MAAPATPNIDLRLIDAQQAAISKKSLQHFAAAACQHPALDLHLVIQLRTIYHLQDRVYRARLGIAAPLAN